uniref:MoaB/Mog domain-containing protein n=1 Tax=Vannella robusta TaxID=1487602 RepID=A0A7S4IEY3_9EUKA|mmetsp:Transcript_24799/g.31562  ORF Transcript_24799/g.31562 Transcript_24799/m.31562 type:complete len:305 (+) Transcript_24799:384-1298(+)
MLSSVAPAFRCRRFHCLAQRLKATTAGCLVIGDEILNGSVQEANVQPLAAKLYKRGVPLTTVQVVRDDKCTIMDSLRDMSAKVDHIFTTGGIGSTHDDITYEAIAETYNTTLKLDVDTEFLLDKELKRREKDMTDERRKMCIFPASASVFRSPLALEQLKYRNEPKKIHSSLSLGKQITSWVPLVAIDKCFIFPGVPHIFRSMLEDFEDRLPLNENFKMIRKDLYAELPEGDVAKLLGETENFFRNHEFPLQIGSYPELIDKDKERYQLRVSLQSLSPEVLQQAQDTLSCAFPFQDTPIADPVK